MYRVWAIADNATRVRRRGSIPRGPRLSLESRVSSLGLWLHLSVKHKHKARAYAPLRVSVAIRRSLTLTEDNLLWTRGSRAGIGRVRRTFDDYGLRTAAADGPPPPPPPHRFIVSVWTDAGLTRLGNSRLSRYGTSSPVRRGELSNFSFTEGRPDLPEH